MHVMSRLLPAALAAALLLATGAQAQIKPTSGTGLKPSVTVVPPGAEPPAEAAEPPASAASAPALSDKEAAASAAAAGWLTLLDRGDWGTAWQTTAGLFRSTVPLDKWMDGIPRVRADLGALVDRTPANATYKTEFPGRPKGDYVTVLFVSRFERRAVEEVVTMVLEPDGRWRATGYSSR